jgi:hypothetical protein
VPYNSDYQLVYGIAVSDQSPPMDGPATYSVTVHFVSSSTGEPLAASVFTIDVRNVDVYYEAGGTENISPPAGGVFTRTIPFSDPGDDVWSGTVNYGEPGAADGPLFIDQDTKTFTLNHTYTSAGSYNVTVTLQDDIGNPLVRSFSVNVYSQYVTNHSIVIDQYSPATIDVFIAHPLGDGTANPANPALTEIITPPESGAVYNNLDRTITYYAAGAFDHLVEGESATVNYVYRLHNDLGDYVDGTVTITILGANHSPELFVDVGATAASGIIQGTFKDFDPSHRPTVSANIRTITQDESNPGAWQWSYDSPDRPAESMVFLVVDDHHGGIASPPPLANWMLGWPSFDLTDEDHTLTINYVLRSEFLAVFASPDVNRTEFLTPLSSGTLTNNFDTTFTFDPAGGFEYLGAGQSTALVIDYRVFNNDDEFNDERAIIAIVGQNDLPSVVADEDEVVVIAFSQASNAGVFADVDLSDRPTITASVGTITQDASNGGAWNWSYSTTVPGTYTVTITADDHHGGVVQTSFELIVNDGDGIADAVDTMPATFSNDFSDGTTTGTIVSRGDQLLTIDDAPNAQEGVIITAAPEGGAEPAVISIDGGATLSLQTGDQLVATHGSVIVRVLAGTVEATFVADSGEVATASLSSGNELTFEPESFVFSAPATNTETVQVLVNGSKIEVGSGQAVRSVQIDITPGNASNALNLASNGVISVAILSTTGFDAHTVDVSSILFAGAHATQSSFQDVNGDGILDLVAKFRTQETSLRSLYEQLVAEDINEDGVLDSNHEMARVSLTGLCQDGTALIGADDLDLFLSGKALRDMLAALAAAGVI